MLAAAALCPHPPLLVPGLAAGATGELDDLRAACDAAVGALLAEPHDLLVAVGAAPVMGPAPAGARGSLRPYGLTAAAARPYGRPTADLAEPVPGGARLPLSLTIARWLLDRAGAGEPLFFGVASDATPSRCRGIGAALAGSAARVGLLIMGDGSTRRTPKPGYLDERAQPFDDAVAAALRAGDPDLLAALDDGLAVELGAAGRAPWQVLAGAAAGHAWRGTVTYADAPYGVGYVAATWR